MRSYLVKKIAGSILLLVLALIIASQIKTSITKAVDVTADFTDRNFLTCVSNALGTPGSVDSDDAAALLYLNCNNSNISSIAGAQHLINITGLFFYNNNISDLSPLSGLTPLKNLGLDDNNIGDITPLAGLINLEQVWLDNGTISDLSPLSGLTNLLELGLNGNNITDLSHLSGLINLENLRLNENNITNISPLTNLTNLNILYLNSSNISDISVLSDKINLTNLTLTNNNISDISPLSGLTAMRFLTLFGNNISNISALNGLINIRHLDLGVNKISDISTLNNMIDIGYLAINSNLISDISTVSYMTTLSDLVVFDNNISDLSSIGSNNPDLANFANRNNIDLRFNPLCDQDDLDEIILLEANGATVTHSMGGVCGDGMADTGCDEQCDDGNTISGDGCSATCQGEYYGCYMTFVTPPITINHYMCDTGCQTFGYAGGWSPNSQSCMCYISNSAVCDAVCTAVNNEYPDSGLTCGFINCGNGIVEPDGVWPTREECDDGNLVSGDGCSEACIIEVIGGGSRRPYVPPCTPLPIKINITDANIQHENGEITIVLNWEKSPEGGIIKIKRNDLIIHTTDDINIKTWIDKNVPKSASLEEYKYQIINESCGETNEGDEFSVFIEPTLPAGTPISVKLDLEIRLKEAYDKIIIEKLKSLFLEDNIEIPNYSMSCKDVKDVFFTTPETSLALEYIITCFGEQDEKLIKKIILRQKEILPPLIAMLKGLNGDSTEQGVYTYISSKIEHLKERINIKESTLLNALENNIDAYSIIHNPDKISIADLDADDIEIIMLIDENYFKGSSHSTNLGIEKYDNERNLIGTYTTYTNILGKAEGVDIGELISGQDYTLKIKLIDKKFVLPKIINLQLNNAVKSEDKYITSVDLVFKDHFRFGDFNEDGVIDFLDIKVWGNLLRGEYENDYKLWQLWDFANIDGREGINLLDILTIQKNWGTAD